MISDLLSKIITSCANGSSILACLWLFYCYFKLRKKTLGLKMILFLSAADFIFHTLMITMIWWSCSFIHTVGLTILNCALRFSIFWASSIAFLAFLSLTHDEVLNPELYFKESLYVSLFISIVLGIICEIGDHSNICLIFTIVIPLAFSLCFTSFYYLKSVFLLRNYLRHIQQPVNLKIRNLYLYAFIQLFTVGPNVLYYLIKIVNGEKPDLFPDYITLPLGLVGFANSLTYFFQRRSSLDESNKSSISTGAPLVPEISFVS